MGARTMTENLIRDITIDGFRAFEHFEMHDLGRVNLLVGKNNCGKSSVLEAIQISSSTEIISTIWSLASARGTVDWNEEVSAETRTADVSGIFHGHSLSAGTTLNIVLQQDGFPQRLTELSLEEPSPKNTSPPNLDFMKRHLFVSRGFLVLKAKHALNGETLEESIVATEAGELFLGTVPLFGNTQTEFVKAVRLLPAEGMTSDVLVREFQQIALTPQEEIVIDLLGAVDDRIWRIASIGSLNKDKSSYKKAFVVALRGFENRIPIGSLGDGVWRMLGLALALVNSAGGTLLVDEIDTGLHYTVMEKMWKLVYEGAKRLNVQVFATTHSRDCVESLAAIATSDEHGEDGADVTIQRIERDKPTAVAFTGHEIVVAAEREIEVR